MGDAEDDELGGLHRGDADLADQAARDREAVTAAMAQGKSLEEAASAYVTEEAFEEWYDSFCKALYEAAGK